MTTVDRDTGEILNRTDLLPSEGGMVGAIVRAELDTQIMTAKASPRSVKAAMDNIMSLATLDEETAKECIYALTRGGKAIRGASIRMAEIIAPSWGNNRVEARVIQIDRVNKMVVAEGTFHDLESNAATRAVVQRRISDKNGRLYNDDMIVNTGNAACSIARRNAILAGVPRAIWRKAYEAVEKVVAGDIKTLTTRRDAAVKAFANFGVKPEQLFALLEVASIEEVGLDDLLTLQGMYSSLKSGEETVETMFDPRRAGAGFDVVNNPLKDDASPSSSAASAAAPLPNEEGKDGGAREQAAPPAAADPLAVAFERGGKAYTAGLQRRAIPGEYRTPDREAEVKEWQHGFDVAAAAAAKGTQSGA